MTPRRSTRSTDWHTTVAVRVLGTDGGSLADGASRQLPRGEDVVAVGDVALQAIEAGLAATTVCVDTPLRTADRFEETALEERLASAPGVERIEEFHPA